MLDQFGLAAQQASNALGWAPSWLISLVILAFVAGVAHLLHRTVYRLITRLVEKRDLFWRSLVGQTEGPTRLILLVAALSIGAGIAPLTPGQKEMFWHLRVVCVICTMGWVALTALHIWTTLYLRRFRLDTPDNLLARKHATQSRILKRVAAIMIVVVTAAAALMTFNSVRHYGVSLLASAGAAGLVVGLALQPLLKSLIAGIQLAVTQPIRLDDAVIVEGEWGNVEEITATYVVVRIWDWRRMVLPLSYFIERPFQNWTRESSSLIGSVMLYVDYSAPVPEMRRKLEEIAHASPLWDQDVVNMQVTDFGATTMQVRMLVSAANSGKSFDLRCEVREKMIGWLQAEYPGALPRQRAEIGRLPKGAAWADEDAVAAP